MSSWGYLKKACVTSNIQNKQKQARDKHPGWQKPQKGNHSALQRGKERNCSHGVGMDVIKKLKTWRQKWKFYSRIRRQNWRNVLESRAKPGENKIRKLENQFRNSIIQIIGKVGREQRKWRRGTSNKIIQNIFWELMDINLQVVEDPLNFEHGRSIYTHTKALSLGNFWTLRENQWKKVKNQRTWNLNIRHLISKLEAKCQPSMAFSILREHYTPLRLPSPGKLSIIWNDFPKLFSVIKVTENLLPRNLLEDVLHQNEENQENRCGIQETGDQTKEKGDCQNDGDVRL